MTPSIAELRGRTQPDSIFARNSGEHWAGKLYMRGFSPYLTRLLIGTRVTPNGVTWLMILVGLVAATVLTLPGPWPALAVVVLIQLQLLLDCADGEVARWRGERSALGVYLDRIGHWLTEAALPIALGLRTGDQTYVRLGLVIAVLVLLIKGESALVTVARAESGQPPAGDTREVAAPRAGVLRRLRRMLGFAPFFRAFVAVEATLLALVADILDATEVLVVALVVVAAVTALGHFVAILTSQRLR